MSGVWPRFLGDAPVTRLAYWRPHPELAGLVSGYHLYVTAPEAGGRHEDVFYPGWANLRVRFGEEPWRLRIGERSFECPRASLFGPTSHAIYSDSGQGAVVGAGITPLGWSRLTDREAITVADRIAPLDDVIGAEATGLADRLTAAEDAEQVPALFDAFFRERMARPRADEARIVAIHELLTTDDPPDVAAAAAAVGLHPRTFNRLSRRAFGFGPKLLLRRARFLRSLMALREPSDEPWASRIGPAYHDQSHFIRDSHEFLGMAPGDFLRLTKPMNDASVRLRAAVLGAPAQALLRPG